MVSDQDDVRERPGVVGCEVFIFLLCPHVPVGAEHVSVAGKSAVASQVVGGFSPDAHVGERCAGGGERATSFDDQGGVGGELEGASGCGGLPVPCGARAFSTCAQVGEDAFEGVASGGKAFPSGVDAVHVEGVCPLSDGAQVVGDGRGGGGFSGSGASVDQDDDGACGVVAESADGFVQGV